MKRLDTILSLLSPGCRLADIGCDHAYIPVAAVSSGAASFAYASDVREGPLSRARENAEKAGLSDRIVLDLADGLENAEKYAPDTVVIAGMGGELIAGIIDKADFVKKGGVRLILQPMTCPEKLRRYLLSAGFAITAERLAKEDRRIYQIIVCEYKKETGNYTETELLTGKNTEDKELLPALYRKYINKYEKIIKGKAASGVDHSFEDRISGELKEKYENNRAL